MPIVSAAAQLGPTQLPGNREGLSSLGTPHQSLACIEGAAASAAVHATRRGCFKTRAFSPTTSRAQSLGVMRLRLGFCAAWFSWPVRLQRKDK